MRNVLMAVLVAVIASGCGSSQYLKAGVDEQQRQRDYEYCDRRSDTYANQQAAAAHARRNPNPYLPSLPAGSYIVDIRDRCMAERGYTRKN